MAPRACVRLIALMIFLAPTHAFSTFCPLTFEGRAGSTYTKKSRAIEMRIEGERVRAETINQLMTETPKPTFTSRDAYVRARFNQLGAIEVAAVRAEISVWEAEIASGNFTVKDLPMSLALFYAKCQKRLDPSAPISEGQLTLDLLIMLGKTKPQANGPEYSEMWRAQAEKEVDEFERPAPSPRRGFFWG